MEFEFTAEVFEWRGPAPYYFVTVPDDACAAISDASRIVTYGWGMIPVTGHNKPEGCVRAHVERAG